MAFTPKIALEYLAGAERRSRLAHAYLITGAPGSGKLALAAELAHLVNGAPANEILAGKRSCCASRRSRIKIARIVIDQIRDLEHALQMRASGGRRKVAVISEADRMMSQAANAFLKTLEEPPNNSLLLLLSSIPEILPETVLSRCIEIPLASPADLALSIEQENLLELLNGLALNSAGGVDEAYRLAQGVLRLFAQMRQTIQDDNAAMQKQEETRYKNRTDGAWLEKREDHYKALTESVYLQQRAQLIETLFLWWGDVLRARTGSRLATSRP